MSGRVAAGSVERSRSPETERNSGRGATSSDGLSFRVATAPDVPRMAECRSRDPAAGPADARMAAYFRGEHHPQQALAPRIGFVALDEEMVVGYTAGHLTTRFRCEGEVQYLFIAPEYRRRGIATALLRLMAAWFREQGVGRVCVNVDADSPAAQPFYSALGALPLRPHWSVWGDIGRMLG